MYKGKRVSLKTIDKKDLRNDLYRQVRISQKKMGHHIRKNVKGEEKST